MGVNTGLLLSRGMQLLIEQVLDGARAANGGLAVVASRNFGTLDSQSLVHDRASSSNELEVRDGATTGRLASGGGEGTQSRGACLVEEGAHALGLVEESLHDDSKIDDPNHLVRAVTV